MKEDTPKVTSNTTTDSIKKNLTKYAQEMIEHINSLSNIAFGDAKYHSQSNSKVETETLTSILLDMLRQNIKLYCKLVFYVETILVKDCKDSF